MVLEHRESIETAKAQGYTYEEIARELERATKEAYPDDPTQWVIIAPSSLRKYYYLARKLQSKNVTSSPKAIANPFERQL